MNEKSSIFKRCNICSCIWNSRDTFLGDPDIDIVGYQVHFAELTSGIFLFNHSCRSTMSFKAGEFMDLYDGPIFAEKLANTEGCPQFCLYKDLLRPCPEKCECASVREVIQIIRQWPKHRTMTCETDEAD